MPLPKARYLLAVLLGCLVSQARDSEGSRANSILLNAAWEFASGNEGDAAETLTDLHLINDSWHDANIHVDLLLTRECPELIPEAACFERPESKWSFDFSLKADSLEKVPVRRKLPPVEGSYWLTARLTGVAGRPVLSQRFVRAFHAPVVPGTATQRTFAVLGGSDAARAFFRTWGLRVTANLGELSPGTHEVVIWDATHLTGEEKRSAKWAR